MNNTKLQTTIVLIIAGNLHGIVKLLIYIRAGLHVTINNVSFINYDKSYNAWV